MIFQYVPMIFDLPINFHVVVGRIPRGCWFYTLFWWEILPSLQEDHPESDRRAAFTEWRSAGEAHLRLRHSLVQYVPWRKPWLMSSFEGIQPSFGKLGLNVLTCCNYVLTWVDKVDLGYGAFFLGRTWTWSFCFLIIFYSICAISCYHSRWYYEWCSWYIVVRMMTRMMMLLYEDHQHVSIYLVIYHICYPFGIIDWQELQRVGVRELVNAPCQLEITMGWNVGTLQLHKSPYLVGGLEHVLLFHICPYIGNNPHPNWQTPSFFRMAPPPTSLFLVNVPRIMRIIMR